MCNKLDDAVNLLYCIVFFSFCNKIFLNNKWGVSCFMDSALNRCVEVSGHGHGLIQRLRDHSETLRAKLEAYVGL